MRYLFGIIIIAIIILTSCGTGGNAMEVRSAADFDAVLHIQNTPKEMITITHIDESLKRGAPTNTKIEAEKTTITEPESTQSQPHDTIASESLFQQPTREQINKQLKIGMTQAAAIKILGNPNEIGISAMTDNVVWRYDFARTEGYTFEESADFKQMGIVDTVDVDGLENGDLHMQIFLTWENEKLSHIVIYESVDGQVTEYRTFANGQAKVTPIN